MNFQKMFNNIVKEAKQIKGDNKFDELFLLTCSLIYWLSCEGENLENILTLLNEFDYEKNFGLMKD